MKKGAFIALRIPTPLVAILDNEALVANCSRSEVVRKAIRFYFSKGNVKQRRQLNRAA